MPKIAPTSPLYAQFRQDFPAQAGEGITGDLNYSDTIVPIVDMTNAAGEGLLPTDLQTAWDFSTGHQQLIGSSATVITNTGFWRVQINLSASARAGGNFSSFISISDGLSSKVVWQYTEPSGPPSNSVFGNITDTLVVYLRSGDSLTAQGGTDQALNLSWRQIATLNGVAINPLGFTFN